MLSVESHGRRWRDGLLLRRGNPALRLKGGWAGGL